MLAAVAACVGIPFWVLLGALAALWRGRTLDVMITGAVLTGVAVPEFVVGTLLILGLAIGAGLFPAVTAVSPNAPLVMFIPALTLPALTLVIGNAAYVTRTTRTGLIAALESESVAAANLRGLDPRRVLLRHAFPQAMGSTLNAAALTVGSFLGGIVVVESLFDYPGLGTLAVNAAANHDLPELQAVTLLGAAAWIVVSLLADAAGVLVNPRLREAAA